MAGRYSLKSIWDDLALPELVRSFTLAVGPIKLLLAFGAVCAICILGFLMDQCSRNVVVCLQNVPESALSAGQTELDAYIQNAPQTASFIERFQTQTAGQGVFKTLWNFTTVRFHQTIRQWLNLGQANFFANVQYTWENIRQCFCALAWAVRFHPIYSVLYFTASFFVLSFIGGAICRCAALEFAREEKPGLFEAVHYAARKYRSYLSAPLIPIGMVVVFSLVVLLVGLAAAVIPWVGDLLLSVLFGFLLFFGWIIVLMAIGVAVGGFLLYPSIAYEGTSGMDSIGRSFSYVLNRPVWMFYYAVAEGVLGMVFYLILRLMIFIVLRFTWGLLKLGMTLASDGDKIECLWVRPEFFNLLSRASGGAAWSEWVASFVIYVFLLMSVGFLMAYIISYIFSAATLIYALMRKKVDQTEYDRIYTPLEQVKG